jgi:KRAB domain-containing zinc finger protein
MRTHSSDKAFECSECAYKTLRIGDLKKHMRAHAGDKSFGCSLCSYKATRKSSLSRHIHIHSSPQVASASTVP